MSQPHIYEQAMRADLIAPVRDWLDKGVVSIKPGANIFTFAPFVRSGLEVRGPWIITKLATDRLCFKWDTIYWKKYKHLAKGCRGCWKVVAKVKTLEQLWKVYKLQQRLGLPAKTGLDTREWTPDIYNAFWYSPMQQGLEGARALWKRVNDAVHAEVDPDLRVILKRACTEMEAGIGPSDQWPPMTEAQEIFERLLDSAWPDPTPERGQTTLVRMHYIGKWVRWAWAHGDPTWKKFASQPLMLPAVEYQTSIHSPMDFPVPTWDREIKGAIDDQPADDPDCLQMVEDTEEVQSILKPEIAEGIALVS